jgi:hypothetical protein
MQDSYIEGEPVSESFFRSGQEPPKLVVYHDSYGDVMKPILEWYLPGVEWRWYKRFEEQYLRGLQPDVVVTLVVERYLRLIP